MSSYVIITVCYKKNMCKNHIATYMLNINGNLLKNENSKLVLANLELYSKCELIYVMKCADFKKLSVKQNETLFT